MDNSLDQIGTPDGEKRYRWLRENVAEYHYHLQVDPGGILHKIHGSDCELTTGFRPEEYAADSKLWIRMVIVEDRVIVER